MSLLTLAQLLTPVTQEQATETLVELLDDMGFQSTSWQTGSVQRTLLAMAAKPYVYLSQLGATIASACFNSLSSGTLLTQFSDSHYDNQRVEAVAAQHTVRLTGAAVGPPYSPAVGDLVATDGTYTFRNITTGTIPASSYVDMTFEAEVAGTSGNVTVGTMTQLQTSLSGVSCTNTEITRAGVDAETDAGLRTRNSTKWASLSLEVTADGYVYYAMSAVPNLRVDVDDTNPRGAGTVDVYIAKGDDVAGGGEVALVQAALDARCIGASGEAGSGIVVSAAVADTINFAYTVYHTGDGATVKAAVEAALTAHINGAPVGGYDYSPGPVNVILYDSLIAAVRAVANVVAVVFTTPSANFSVTPHHVAVVGTFPASGSYIEV